MSAPGARVAVIGAGASGLVADLARGGGLAVVALDIAAAALDQCRSVVESDPASVAGSVSYVVGDVLDVELPGPIDVWHDRATFHFFTDPADQRRYADRVAQTLRPGGHLLLAGFAEDGPEQCSGLPVARHDLGSLQSIFERFELLDSHIRDHHTPWDSTQRFRHTTFRNAA